MPGCAALAISRDTVEMKKYFTLKMRARNAEHEFTGNKQLSRINRAQPPHVWRLHSTALQFDPFLR